MISHVRRQHAVGQGLFHSAEVDFNATKLMGFPWAWPLAPKFDIPKQPTAMRYVYDCGSTTGATSREREVDSVIQRYGVGASLDFVFLSHADKDHVNGLKQLLDSGNGLHATNIVMPNLSVFERLAAWAASAIVGGAGAGIAADDTYGRLIIDPVGTLQQELGATRIVLVGGDDVGPNAAEPRGIRPGDDEGDPDRDFTWRMDGVRESLDGEQNVFYAPSGTPIMVGPTLKGADDWILLPHVASAIEKGLGAFVKELAKQLGTSVVALENLLKDVNEVAKLLRDKTDKVKDAYDKTAPSVNATTLSLFSGPTAGHTARGWQLEVGAGPGSNRRFLLSGPVGWLGTGDAEFQLPGYLADFLSIMAPVQDQVGIMTVPHHGSFENQVPGLWDAFPALHTCVTSADPSVKADGHRSWRHPATEVVLEIGSHGFHHIVVTADERSNVSEWVIVD